MLNRNTVKIAVINNLIELLAAAIVFVLLITIININTPISKTTFRVEAALPNSDKASQKVQLFYHLMSEKKNYYLYYEGFSIEKEIQTSSDFQILEFKLPAKKIDKILLVFKPDNGKIQIKKAGLYIGKNTKYEWQGSELFSKFTDVGNINQYLVTNNGVEVVYNSSTVLDIVSGNRVFGGALENKTDFYKAHQSVQKNKSIILYYLLSFTASVLIFFLIRSKPVRVIFKKFSRFREPAWLIFLSFIFFNSLKISLLNWEALFWDVNLGSVLYKMVFTGIVSFLTFYIMYRRFPKICLVFYVFQIFYIFLNVSYFEYFNRILFIDYAITMMADGVTAATDSGLPFYYEQFYSILDLPFVLILYIRHKGSELHINHRKIIYSIGVAVIFAMTIYYYMNGYSLVYKDGKLQYYVKAKSRYILFEDRHFTSGKILKGSGLLYMQISDLLFPSEEESEIVYSKNIISNNVVKQKNSVVCIQVESLDANMVLKKHNNKFIMPYMNSLLGKSIYYPYTMSYHLGGLTSDAEVSILNSVHPLVKKSIIKISSYDYPNSIVNDIKKEGYDAYAFHGNVGTYFNRLSAFPAMGFDGFIDRIEMDIPEKEAWGILDHEVLDYVYSNLGKSENPFFYYVITMTSHAPFSGVLSFYKNPDFDDISNKWTRDLFTSFNYVDKSLSEFVENTRKNYPDVYIIIYGDHCPRINSDYYTEAGLVVDAKLFEFVPLIILTPDNKVYREENLAAGFVDIGPTILDITGVKYELLSDGQSLISNKINDTELSMRGKGYKRSYLYDKAKETTDKN